MGDKKDGDVRIDNRIIYIHGLFDEDMAEKVIAGLLDLERRDPGKDILVIIDSYGGNIHSFLAMHDVIKFMVRSRVATLCIGKAFSCGQMLLMTGSKGKRFMTPNARVLTHELWLQTSGKLASAKRDMRESEKLMKILRAMICKYTKIKPADLNGLLQDDTYLSSEDCVRLGIVDRIVSGPDDLYKHLKL